MDNVKSLEEQKKKKEAQEEEPMFDFSALIEKNKKAKERVEKERSQHNNGLAKTLKPTKKR